MLKKRGLAFKLSVYLLTAVFCILFALFYYNYVISRNLALQDAKNDAQKLTELTVARIENRLKAVENIPINLASMIENRDTIMFIGTRRIIETILEKNPLIYGACVAFIPRVNGSDTFFLAPYLYATSDSLLFKDLAAETYRYTTKSWYIEARDEGKGIWSEPYYDEGGGNAMMATYSVPFYRDHGSGRVFAGVVTADISLTGLQDIIRDIQFYDSGMGFLISGKGNIVTYPGIDTLTNNSVQNILERDITSARMQVILKMVNGESGIISMRHLGGIDDKDDWISYAHVPTANWSLGIQFHEKELYNGIHKLFLKLIIIALGGFILLGLLIFFIAGRFVKPIEKLAFATRKIGAGEFEFQIPSFKSNDEISQLGKSFSIMQLELKEYIKNLQETTAQKEKIESELQIASNIQQQMLPEIRQIPGREGIRYYGILKPARQVGGDFYDFIIRDKFLYFAIGDVSGKGIPAALFMAKTLTLFRAKVSGGKDPGELASEINHELEKYNAESMFVTFFIGKLNLESGEIIYTNAGHNLPYMLNGNNDISMLKGTHGLPLGSMAMGHYMQDSVHFLAGDKIILFTDGIPEATNLKNELFGDSRLEALLNEHAIKPPQDIGEAILLEVDTFAAGTEQADDITLFILEYN